VAVQLSYLQSLAYAEGRSLTRQGLERFLETRTRSEEPGSGKGKQIAQDLRHAINLLQVFLVRGEPELSGFATLSENRATSLHDDTTQVVNMSAKESVLAQWKRDAHEAETRSFLDSQLGFTGLPSVRACLFSGRGTADLTPL
jgi:hypothetical protein